MKKRLLVMALTLAMIVAFSACGGGSGDSGSQDGGSKSSETVDSIDLTFDEGNLKYVGFEKAVPELTDAENAYIFIFDFTNYQDAAARSESVFWIQFFQNGVELADRPSYSSEGGEQYELLNAYFSEAMNGGTLRFGLLVVPKDNSPITIQAKRNGAEDKIQTMEVDLGDESTADTGNSESASADDIDSMLQGEWAYGSNSFLFDNGSLSVLENGSEVMSGEYSINTSESTIVGVIHASDGDVKINLPYILDGGVLHVQNNKGEDLTHK